MFEFKIYHCKVIAKFGDCDDITGAIIGALTGRILGITFAVTLDFQRIHLAQHAGIPIL